MLETSFKTVFVHWETTACIWFIWTRSSFDFDVIQYAGLYQMSEMGNVVVEKEKASSSELIAERPSIEIIPGDES
jgi:hypothetical protein